MGSPATGRVVFVGDAVTALGFRLAGVETRVVDAAGVSAALAQARADAALVIMTAELVAGIPAKVLRSHAPGQGIVTVVESARGGAGAPDLGREVRRELGILP